MAACPGTKSALMKPCQGKDKYTNRFHFFKDQDSVDARHDRVRGIGNIQQRVPHHGAATPLALPTKKYTTYHGGAAGNVIGPVVMQNASAQWTATWHEKKLIYGIATA